MPPGEKTAVKGQGTGTVEQTRLKRGRKTSAVSRRERQAKVLPKVLEKAVFFKNFLQKTVDNGES